MNRFVSPERLLDQKTVTLDPEQSHHAVLVLRHQVGDPILLIDGLGALAQATVKAADKKRLICEISDIKQTLAVAETILAFGIAKSQAVDFMLRRCTEVGVTSFFPLLTDHSLQADVFNVNRWEKVVTEVCKQCERLFFPKIQRPSKLDDFLRRCNPNHALFYCSEDERFEKPDAPQEGAILVIGPEGGWSEGEKKMLSVSGRALGLGATRLRTETAALAAVVRIGVLREWREM